MKLVSRDLFYAVLLIMLVKVAISHRNSAIIPSSIESTEQTHEMVVNANPAIQPVLRSFSEVGQPTRTLSQAPSAAAQAPQQEISKPVKPEYNFEEMEKNFMAQIDTAQKQVDAVLPRVKDTSEQAAHLRSLKQKLAHVRQAYQQSLAASILDLQTTQSPTQEIEGDLLRAVNKLGGIMHELNPQQSEFVPAQSIMDGLRENHKRMYETVS